MNMPKIDSFVTMVKLLSDKLVEKELECVELTAHIAADHAKLDDMQQELSDIKYERERLWDERDNLRAQVRTQGLNEGDMSYYKERCKFLEQELLSYRQNDPRAKTYMEGEGARLYHSGNKIGCIKGVRECTGWGLKEAKDYVEAVGPTCEVKEDSGPGTKPSQDLVRKTG